MPSWFWGVTIGVHILTGWAGAEAVRRRGGNPWFSGLFCVAGGIGALLGLLIYLRIKK